jgi:hypothetical protein
MSNQHPPSDQPDNSSAPVTGTKSDRDNQIKQRIAEERLFQASFSFKLASIATAAFATISLIGAGLLLSGNLSEGTLTTASGAGSSIYFFKLAKDANDRLDRIFAELND